ncbi:MAG: hypothetical protein JW803_01705 [Endomicrobiales bacterium]|nr:hypothetical protein [Endomicrobiales bacterium]
MNSEKNGSKVREAEIVVSPEQKNQDTILAKFSKGIAKAGTATIEALKSKKVQAALLYLAGIFLREVAKMPRGDGTGPFGGGGPGSGRRGGGRFFGGGGGGRGRGMGGGNRQGSGPGGYCVCPSCGNQVAHQQGVPCYSVKCPNCGAQMMKA